MSPSLVTNPRSDEEFVRLAERLVAAGTKTPQALQDELRRTYPKAIVRRRILDGERLETWYVYREGTWIGPTSR
jgi:hypothetical protein